MRVLSITHEIADGAGGLFENVVYERGDELVHWLAPEREAPGRPEEFDAVMVFGGTMHPDQDAEHPWLPAEADFVRETLAARVPLLGVCLGSQLIARASGAWVGPAERGEVGWAEVGLTDAGRSDPVLGSMPARFDAFQWHYYTFDLPPGAELLAANGTAKQAYRIGDHAWAVQFHPEITSAMHDHWIVWGASELPVPVEQLREESSAKLPVWNSQGRALCNAFLDVASARS
jgi:GMP synthase (glutamine-hydrolysing)